MTAKIFLPGLFAAAPRTRSTAARGAACCWVVEAEEAWDELHYPTRAEAEQAAQRGERPPVRFYQLERPCVEVTCRCGAYELGEDEYSRGLHFPTRSAAQVYADDLDLTIHDDGWLVFNARQAWNQHGRHSVWCASLTAGEDR